MKKLIFAVALVGFLLVLVISNPGSEEYSDYLREEMAREAEQEGEVASALATLFGGVAQSLLENATTRDNYVLFSVFTTGNEPDELIVLGILGNFIVLSEG